MRFIGNKELLTPKIRELLEDQQLANRGLTLFDAFSGTGAVSDALKDSFNIVANDLLKWCVTYTQGRVVSAECRFETLGFDPFEYLNASDNIIQGFFYKNYSPTESSRMYFSSENAGRIDYFRLMIEDWKNSSLIDENEYAYLLASLIESVSAVSNTAGVYGAFLKHWDPRAKKPIEFKRVDASRGQHNDAKFLNSRIEDVVSEVDCDILYIDPPYTQNQYGTQYHLLETLVLYDAPSISKITGSRSTGPLRSDWSKGFKSHILLDKILAKTTARYIVFSYSRDGFMSRSFIEAILKRYGKAHTYMCKTISFRKYTNSKSKEKNDHYEYLFFIERKDADAVSYESPLNYIGSKAKMALRIKENTPKQLGSFVDAFGGGFNVGININADRIVYNDVNHFVTELVESFKAVDTYQYILFLKRTIKRFDLKAKDVTSYNRARSYYNSLPVNQRDPKLLFAVILYGFNQQIRFNADHDFNNPVGMRWFNDKVLEKMISFSRELKEKNVCFRSKDYRDLLREIDENSFTYLDPPYMLTNGSYNDGKRGFHGWNSEIEADFFDFVDKLNDQGKPFLISYVMEHKGKFNHHLGDWIKSRGYRIVEVDPFLGNNRKEILITNCSTDDETALYHKKQISKAV